MIHISAGDEHYVASEAAIKAPDHKMPAGTLYKIELALATSSRSMEDQYRILRDIARAERRQWIRRMVAAGVAAGASFALMRHLIDALFG